MSDTIYKGQDVNKKFIEIINKYAETFAYPIGFENNSNTIETNFTREIDGKQETIYTSIDYKEHTELLAELKNVLKDLEGTPEELFQIPLASIPKDYKVLTDSSKTTEYSKETFYITKTFVQYIARKKDKYKSLLGIEFPEELYQLSRSVDKTDTIPGYSFNAPPLRKYNQTATEYEKEMYAYYAEKGVKIKYKSNGRGPLPHEQVKYSNLVEPTMIENNGIRESYSAHMTELGIENFEAKGLITNKGQKGFTNKGERKKITGTRTAGEKLSDALSTVRGIVKPQRTMKLLLLAALVISCASMGILPALSIAPGLFIGKAAITVAELAAVFVGIRAIKDRKLIKEWLNKRKNRRKGENDSEIEDVIESTPEVEEQEQIQIGSDSGLFDAIKTERDELVRLKTEIEMHKQEMGRIEKTINDPSTPKEQIPALNAELSEHKRLHDGKSAIYSERVRKIHDALDEYRDLIIPPEEETPSKSK